MPRWTHRHHAALLAAGTLGCATTVAAQNPVPPADVLPESAPVAVMERLAQQCRDAFAARPLTEVAYASSRGAWVKRSYAPADVELNVQKTASAVTPYVAQLTVTELASAQPGGGDFDAARAMDVPMDRNLLRSVRRMHFAFQGGEWNLMGAAVLMQVKADATMDFETARSAKLEPAAVRQFDGPIAACTLQPH